MLDRKLSILTAVLAAGVLALPTFAQPGNDNCADATPVIGPSTSFGDTSSSSNDGTGACGLSADSADVWFRLTNTTAARAMYDVDLFGSGYDTVLAAFSDCGGSELACNDDT